VSGRIGFIGLGVMGKPMSRNLLKAGYKLTVYDLFPDAVQEIVEAGATSRSSAKEVASRSDIVITMLPDGPRWSRPCLVPVACWKARGPVRR
jgi:2-hydroxy-3-oxopropionate reductase